MPENEKKITIRAHHLLCLLGFAGRGYSPEFTENLSRIKSAVWADPGVRIKLTDKGDDICSCCPHLEDGDCCKEAGLEEKTKEHDWKVLSALELTPGAELEAAQLYKQVAQTFNPRDLDDLCSDCEWLSLGWCRMGLEELPFEKMVAGEAKELKCVFCSPDKKDIICENDLAFAAWDRYPVNPGHCLVIIRRHFSDPFQATPEEWLAVWELVGRLKKVLDDKHCPDGYNIGVNVGKAGGQSIFHLHLHVIPRFKGDVKRPRGGIRNILHC